MRRVALALLAVAVVPVSVAAAAEPRPLALAVSGAQGQFVADLRASELRVLENGEPRELAGFELDKRPLAVALVLDTSEGAVAVFRTEAFDAVWGFVASLPPGTRTTLWGTGDRPRKLGTLEPERQQVEKKVGQALASQGANALMDTVVEAAGGLAGESGRRRALVVLSGWGAGHSTHTPNDVTSGARKAAAPVFALMYGEGEAARAGNLVLGPAPRDADNLTLIDPADHQRILSGLAQGTGGRFERVPSALGAARAFGSLTQELAGQYRIRYLPGEAGGPKRVEVRIARPGVRWRVMVDSP